MVRVRIESDEIKTILKDVCKEDGDVGAYNLLSTILDYLDKHENMPRDARDEHVKEIIDDRWKQK